MSRTHKVVFTPSGLSLVAEEGQSVLDAAREAGVEIASICGGRGLCRRCQVHLQTGHHAKFAMAVNEDSLTPSTTREDESRARGHLPDDRRMACQARIMGDCVIDLPADTNVAAMHISKGGAGFAVRHDPPVRLYLCELPIPDLDDNPDDASALAEALSAFGISAWPDLHALTKLQPVLARNERRVIAVVRDGVAVVDIWPPSTAHIYGAALDIGSTSLALYLYDLTSGGLIYEASAPNPQIRFGEDLMSRVSYIMMNKGSETRLTGAVREGVATLIAGALTATGIAAEHVLELVAVGNPIMHHLFLGINPVELGQAPFTLAVKDWLEAPAGSLGLGLPAAARVQMLPLIGGHVGADTTGAYLSQMDGMEGRSVLLVDIGTNAEILLAHNGRVAACSSPTGPAFEGAEITAGVRAAPGAIARVRIDPATGNGRVQLIGDEAWYSDAEPLPTISGICGSGILEVMAELASAGLVDAGGRFRPEGAPHRFVPDGQTVAYVLVERSPNPIIIRQTDVRAVQLAKAALAAGVKLLANHLGCASFDEVLLAGAFGTHLDPAYVAGIGIIPDANASIIRAVGNAAGQGAAMALNSITDKARIIAATATLEKVETATEPRFQEYFVAAMSFPGAPDMPPVARQRRRRQPETPAGAQP